MSALSFSIHSIPVRLNSGCYEQKYNLFEYIIEMEENVIELNFAKTPLIQYFQQNLLSINIFEVPFLLQIISSLSLGKIFIKCLFAQNITLNLNIKIIQFMTKN